MLTQLDPGCARVQYSHRIHSLTRPGFGQRELVDSNRNTLQDRIFCIIIANNLIGSLQLAGEACGFANAATMSLLAETSRHNCGNPNTHRFRQARPSMDKALRVARGRILDIVRSETVMLD